MWPVASSGLPHSGHGGRPERITRNARSTNVRAASAVSRTRRRSGPSSSSSSTSTSSSASASSSSSGPGARASMRIRSAVAVPAEGQRRRPERLVERLVEGPLVGQDRGRRVLDDAPPVELDEEPAEALREHRDLGLLERRRSRRARRRGPGGRTSGCPARRSCPWQTGREGRRRRVGASWIEGTANGPRGPLPGSVRRR